MTTTSPSEVVALARQAADGARFLPAHDASREQVIEAINAVEFMWRTIKEARSDFYRERMVEWLQEHGDLEWDGRRWYLGSKRTVRLVVPVGELVDAVLKAVGGDLAAFCQTLTASPFKAGYLRDVLGDEWRRCFREESVPDVKTGKPRREVNSVPVRVGR